MTSIHWVIRICVLKKIYSLYVSKNAHFWLVVSLLQKIYVVTCVICLITND